MLEINKIHQGDCLEVMKDIDDASVDMILCDLPYGTTNCKWDSLIDLDKLWTEYTRIIKERGVIVLTAQTPFDKVLGCSNISLLKYEWIWEKTSATGHLNAKKMPLKAHENILIFYKKTPTYNPQKTKNHTPVHTYTKKNNSDGEVYGKTTSSSGGGSTERYPRSIQIFSSDKQKCNLHSTQKPLKLFAYLIKTYSNEGDLVLDNCIGSGTTAVACMFTNRNFIGIELDKNYCERARKRIEEK